MTVKELIEKLQKEDPNKIVCTIKSMSEDGVPDISEAKILDVFYKNKGKYFQAKVEQVLVVI